MSVGPAVDLWILLLLRGKGLEILLRSAASSSAAGLQQ
jgi:hypothetical protein